MSPYFPPHTSVVKGRSVPATNLILKTKPFMANQERLKYLFQRYIDHTETPGELEELMLLIETRTDAADRNRRVQGGNRTVA